VKVTAEPARTAKVLAVARFGAVAAKALFCIMLEAESISTDITKMLLMLFFIIISFLLVEILSRAYTCVSLMDKSVCNNLQVFTD